MSNTPRTDARVAADNPVGVPGNTALIATSFARALERELTDRNVEIVDLKARLAEIESNCDHEWKTEDHSFSHEFGTEKIFVCRCEKCGKDREPDDADPDNEPPEREPDYDAERPLTPLENWQRNDEHNVP